ncbi:MAG: hypothetical protein NVSMB1_05470 [Polyangiales bacterium]
MSAVAKRVLVLAKKSALRVHQEGQDVEHHDRVEALLRAKDSTVSRMRGAHEQHEATLLEVRNALDALRCEVKWVVASALDEFRVIDPAGHDLVVTVGGDGTLLAASHGIADAPVLAINSAPSYSVGFFAGGRMGNVRETLDAALLGTLPMTLLTRMQVIKNEERLTRRVLNEVLVCCSSPAATSRYILEHAEVVEEQKSSGIFIGPAAGSTAAQRSAGGRVLSLTSQKLQFVVREPYTLVGERLRLPRGLLPNGTVLRMRVKMGDGQLFVDGPHHMYRVTTGDLLQFSASDEPLHLMGVVRRRGWKRKTGRSA